MPRVTVEIVCCSVADALATERGGAHRIELCSALDAGGLTPSLGLLEEVKSRCCLPVMAMVRPRPGGFCYTEDERAVMARDAKKMRGDGPTVFAQVKNDVGVDAIVEQVVRTWERATAKAR